MFTIISLTALVISSACLSSSQERDIPVQTVDGHKIRIPSTFIVEKDEFVGWARDLDGNLDSSSGTILLRFSESKLETEIQGFKKAASTDDFLVMFYLSPIDHQFLGARVMESVEFGEGNISNGKGAGHCRVQVSPTWWFMTDGLCVDSDSFRVDRYLGSCRSSILGVKCEYYVEWSGSHYVYSLHGPNVNLASDVSRYVSKMLTSWGDAN